MTEKKSPRPRRWLQFSLRGVFLLFVVAAGAMYWLHIEVAKARKQRLAAEAILSNGGRITFSGSAFFAAYGDSSRLKALPTTWWTRLLGDDPRLRVEFASVGASYPISVNYLYQNGDGDQSLPHVCKLRDIRTLWARGNSVSDEGLQHLYGMESLHELDLRNAKVTDASASTIGSLINLQKLDLSGTQCGNDTLAHLEGHQHLEHLILDKTNISDAGLKYLIGLPNLKRLSLAETEIGDQGLATLSQATGLQVLNIGATHVTDEGLQALSGLASLKELTAARYGDLLEFTDEGLAAFKRARADINVTYYYGSQY